jgi:hypothetical protein
MRFSIMLLVDRNPRRREQHVRTGLVISIVVVWIECDTLFEEIDAKASEELSILSNRTFLLERTARVLPLACIPPT